MLFIKEAIEYPEQGNVGIRQGCLGKLMSETILKVERVWSNINYSAKKSS